MRGLLLLLLVMLRVILLLLGWVYHWDTCMQLRQQHKIIVYVCQHTASVAHSGAMPLVQRHEDLML